ncbi:MAG: hypothetical protein LBF22_09485 [Deltaproteobacteria bacterium]|jgi:hypothetical protein|nr:hypothetical protein [Deltaproteobacteria bacterium]
MLNRIFSLFFVTFFLFGAFTLFAIFSPSLEAQPGEDPNYEYPVLSDEDFQFFIYLMNGVIKGNSEAELIKNSNVPEEHAQAVSLKIIANYFAKFTNDINLIKSTFGNNFEFNSSETALYEKYQSDINVIFDTIYEAGKGSER